MTGPERVDVATKAWSGRAATYLDLVALGQFERAADERDALVSAFEAWCDVVAQIHREVFEEMRA